MSEKTENPFDLDNPSFDAEKYLERLLKECTLKQIMDTEAAVVKDTQTLHSDMQTLVYENYNKFISATDTIRKMKTDFKQMEEDMNFLHDKMQTITTFSEQITGTLQGTRTQLCRLAEKHSLLKRLQFLSSLPAKLKTLIQEQSYAQAVQDYMHAQKVFAQYGRQPSFDGIQRDCEEIMLQLKITLRSDFQLAGKTAQTLTEIGELLLLLNERAADLAADMLACASKRLHEQIVMLQDQTERDMIEFIDMGIEGFLNDLTLVVTSYYDMFVSKRYDNENDDFQDKALHDLNIFVNSNLEKYLALVQDRVDSNIGHGDTQIMLRALDRLHRRLMAMRNICHGIEIKHNTVDIIIGAAQQLCEMHARLLKDHFQDSLSSVRLALVSSKSDSSVAEKTTLNDIITNLYVSMVEKVKGVLQDLLVFMQNDWSFNIKTECKGSLCIENIRENLLIGFLRNMSKVMASFADASSSSPPNLLLVLCKTCLEMEQTGVHILISLVDDLYEIDSENSATLTHETEIGVEMRETAQTLLDCYVRLQGNNISQMLRKSVETRDWLNCLEPRTVRAVMKRVVEELGSIELIVAALYEPGGNLQHTTASSDSSRKTHYSHLLGNKSAYRGAATWSSYTPSQLETTYASNIHRLFSERIDIFTSVEFSKVSILTGIIKIALKTLLECVRLRTFSKYGLQQIQVDTHYLQINLWRFVTDENLVNFLLDEILGSAVHRCLESILMEPNAVEIICERG